MQIHRDGETIGPPLPDVYQGLILPLCQPDTYHPVLGARAPVPVILSDEPHQLDRQLVCRAVLGVSDSLSLFSLLTLCLCICGGGLCVSAVGPRACAPGLPGLRGAPVAPTPADRVLAPALLAGVSSRAALLTARPVRACALLLLICRPVRDMRTACPGYPARMRCSRTSVGSRPLR